MLFHYRFLPNSFATARTASVMKARNTLRAAAGIPTSEVPTPDGATGFAGWTAPGIGVSSDGGLDMEPVAGLIGSGLGDAASADAGSTRLPCFHWTLPLTNG
jgi:hypothetical protein